MFGMTYIDKNRLWRFEQKNLVIFFDVFSVKQRLFFKSCIIRV